MKNLYFIAGLIIGVMVVAIPTSAVIVQEGDTICRIGDQFGLTCEETISLNPQIENPDLIHPGQEINVDSTSVVFGSSMPIAGNTYNLAGKGVSGSATSIILQSLTIKQTGQKIVDSDLPDTFYITLEPGNNKRQEIVSCTTVTQGTNSATLSGCIRGLAPISPYTASSSLEFAHGGGTQVIFSDPPQLFNEYAAKENAESISALWSFIVIPDSSDECTETNELCTKTYIDNSVNQGAATSTEDIAGIAQLATAQEAASSTDNGINDPLVLQAKTASSTPSANVGLQVVMSENDGKLAQGWLDLTESYTWSVGSQIFSNGFLSTASTTLANTTTTGDFFISGSPRSTNGLIFDITKDEIENKLFVTVTPGVSSSTLEYFIQAAGDISVGFDGVLISVDGDGNAGIGQNDNLAIYDKDFDLMFNATLSAAVTQDVLFGMTDPTWSKTSIPADKTSTDRHVAFYIQDGNIFASMADGTTQETEQITGITLTNRNTYRIVWTAGADAKFYVNGVLESTLSTQLPTTNATRVEFGLHNRAAGTKTFQIDANWVLKTEL